MCRSCDVTRKPGVFLGNEHLAVSCGGWTRECCQNLRERRDKFKTARRRGSRLGERVPLKKAAQSPTWGFQNPKSVELLGKCYNKNQITIWGPGGGSRIRKFPLSLR